MTRLSLLVELGSMLAREVDLDAWLGSAAQRLADAMAAERATVWLVDGSRGCLVSRVATSVEGLEQPLGRGIAGQVAETGHVVRLDEARSDARFDPTLDRATGFETRSMLAVPIRESSRASVLGVVQVLNAHRGFFDDDDARYLEALASDLARALQLTTLAPESEGAPGVVLRGPFNRIIGRCPAMEAVYDRIRRAAPTDASVLFRGETGTGKSLLARALHVASSRQNGPFVTVDCTTLPRTLAESELFGHERGAFTGADRRVAGKVELARGGTLFLDEIGELAVDLQAKLLRLTQEGVYSRVGGHETLRAEVRVIAATHVDLEQAVRRGSFRQDLYYRLRVVEVEVPPLRSRGVSEIESLANHFAEVFAKKYGRSTRLGPSALSVLAAHDWPGNVRELEHAVEAAVVLAAKPVLEPEDLPMRRVRATESLAVEPAVGLTLDEAMQRYIVATLEASAGNQSEAARRLGIARNTVAKAARARRRQ